MTVVLLTVMLLTAVPRGGAVDRGLLLGEKLGGQAVLLWGSSKEDKAYIEDRDLWTMKEVRQIGHSAWHF